MKSSSSLLLMGGSLLSAGGFVLATNDLTPQKYLHLPMGDVKPVGWLLEQLDVPGEIDLGKDTGFYEYLAHADTEWSSRPSYTHTIEGAGSHWFNDMVTVAAVLNNPILKSQTEQFLDYFLDTQGEDGWLGPEANSTKLRHFFARHVTALLPFLRGAIRVAEAQLARAGRIATALNRFAALVYETLQRGGDLELEDDDWAYAGDLLVVLQWLYENHPDGHEAPLLETMQMLAGLAEDASAHMFMEENIPTSSSNGPGLLPDVRHDMNIAKALTTLGAVFRLGQDAISDTWDALFEKRGQLSGLLVLDTGEFVSDRGAQGHIAAETLRSMLYLHQLTGNPRYAEQADRALYNAMVPTQRFRPLFFGWGTTCCHGLCKGASPANEPSFNLFSDWPLDEDLFCCAIRYPEGTLDYVHSAFLVTADRASLVHAHLGPFTVNTTLANDNMVAVTVDTTYPHSSNASFTTTIVAQNTFDYYVRIPSWADSAVISFGDGSTKLCNPVAGLHRIHIPAGTTSLDLAFDLPITTDRRASGFVSVHRGPLLFVFDLYQQPGGDMPHRALRYAIDPSTLSESACRLQRHKFELHTDYTISVAACPISWGDPDWDTGRPPQLRPGPVTCIGPVRNITLTWYKVSSFPHAVVKEFPTFSLADLEGPAFA